ncbi:RNA polymerase sigma-70 factor (sigma-E family) [Streptomyces sp. 3211.6]|uniref:RNA polymerase sigma factor n=1 Tax=Streptomyces TaxID=1883 RepID=UPI000CCACA90|nr:MULTISPECIES: SigE family RNA polymerase sigma factor [Streptomyces]RKT02796.1 RNA polymerase sigma-70 factor (sigma-E family) [Streptomyces sp. 3211.6]RPF44120.1 RNA polymerase sigma-70 factor (sigma-E family) [Streptomyces sp. Ag109_G2-6]
MLALAPSAGPAVPVSPRARRGLWWWLTRRETPAPPAGPGARPYPYTYGPAGRDPGDTAPAPTVSELYHAHRLSMVRLAVLLVDDLGTAEDVVQDAFTALYRRYGEQIAEVDNALGYLRTAVVNTARSVLRRRRTARAWVPPVTADVPSAEASVVLDEAHREVLAALGRLTPRRRQVLVLRYWADLSEAEIAETLGISRGSVKSNASRALDALERILEGRV